MEILSSFAAITGLKITYEKTEAIIKIVKKHHNLKWVTGTKILGIHFKSVTSAHCIEDNWRNKKFKTWTE